MYVNICMKSFTYACKNCPSKEGILIIEVDVFFKYKQRNQVSIWDPLETVSSPKAGTMQLV